MHINHYGVTFWGASIGKCYLKLAIFSDQWLMDFHLMQSAK